MLKFWPFTTQTPPRPFYEAREDEIATQAKKYAQDLSPPKLTALDEREFEQDAQDFDESTAQFLRQDRLNSQGKIEINVTPEAFMEAGTLFERKINLHPLFLLTPHDIKGVRLEKNHFFADLKKKNICLLRSTPTQKEEQKILALLPVFRKLWKEASLFQRMKNFSIAHEVAHIHFGHQKSIYGFSPLITYVLTPIASIFLATSFVSFALLLPISYLVINLGVKFFLRSKAHANEKEADLTALKLTKDPAAPIKFFSLMGKRMNQAWKEVPLWKKAWTAITFPDFAFQLSHPSPQTRINYLRKA